MKSLVKNLGDQFNLPLTTIKDLDLDVFVDNAIKVEEGELETLRVILFYYVFCYLKLFEIFFSLLQLNQLI